MLRPGGAGGRAGRGRRTGRVSGPVRAGRRRAVRRCLEGVRAGQFRLGGRHHSGQVDFQRRRQVHVDGVHRHRVALAAEPPFASAAQGAQRTRADGRAELVLPAVVNAVHDSGGADAGGRAEDALAEQRVRELRCEDAADAEEEAAHGPADGTRHHGGDGVVGGPLGAVALEELDGLDGDIEADVHGDAGRDRDEQPAQDHLHRDPGGGDGQRDDLGRKEDPLRDLRGQQDELADDHVLGVLDLYGGVFAELAQLVRGLGHLREAGLQLGHEGLELVGDLPAHALQDPVAGRADLPADALEFLGGVVPRLAEGVQVVLVALGPGLTDGEPGDPGQLGGHLDAHTGLSAGCGATTSRSSSRSRPRVWRRAGSPRSVPRSARIPWPWSGRRRRCCRARCPRR